MCGWDCKNIWRKIRQRLPGLNMYGLPESRKYKFKFIEKEG